MKNALTLSLAALIGFTALIPSSAAYNGFVSDVRYGEHPYETRTRDENRRKRFAKEAKKYGVARVNSPAYFHPIYAKRSTLPPFYRKGGTSYNFTARYAQWRGYQDPIRAHQLSPDSYCMNFSYARFGRGNHGQPVGYQCF